MRSADLYFDRIDVRRYLDESGCRACGYPSCEAFIEATRAGRAALSNCSFLSANRAHALRAVEEIKSLWPDVPVLMHPRPAFTGLLEVNEPDPSSLVLVTGNNEYTEEVLMTVLGTTACPFFVLFVDTDGNTVDMSMIYGTLTVERIAAALERSGLLATSGKKECIVPGLAASLREGIEGLTSWSVRVGPECAAELPLYLWELWAPAKKETGQG